MAAPRAWGLTILLFVFGVHAKAENGPASPNYPNSITNGIGSTGSIGDSDEDWGVQSLSTKVTPRGFVRRPVKQEAETKPQPQPTLNLPYIPPPVLPLDLSVPSPTGATGQTGPEISATGVTGATGGAGETGASGASGATGTNGTAANISSTHGVLKKRKQCVDDDEQAAKEEDDNEQVAFKMKDLQRARRILKRLRYRITWGQKLVSAGCGATENSKWYADTLSHYRAHIRQFLEQLELIKFPYKEESLRNARIDAAKLLDPTIVCREQVASSSKLVNATMVNTTLPLGNKSALSGNQTMGTNQMLVATIGGTSNNGTIASPNNVSSSVVAQQLRGPKKTTKQLGALQA